MYRNVAFSGLLGNIDIFGGYANRTVTRKRNKNFRKIGLWKPCMGCGIGEDRACHICIAVMIYLLLLDGDELLMDRRIEARSWQGGGS